MGEVWAIMQNVEDGKNHTEFRVDEWRRSVFEDWLCVQMIRHFSREGYTWSVRERTINHGRYVEALCLRMDRVFKLEIVYFESFAIQRGVKTFWIKFKHSLDSLVHLKLLDVLESFRIVCLVLRSYLRYDVFIMVSLLRDTIISIAWSQSYPFLIKFSPDILVRKNLNPFWIVKRESMRKQSIPFVKDSLEESSPELRLTGKNEELCELVSSFHLSIFGSVIMFYLNPAMLPMIFEPLIFETFGNENLCYDPFEMNFDILSLNPSD
ncbi:hypothetical protein Tco_0139944 [Tanacetum coccineum]